MDICQNCGGAMVENTCSACGLVDRNPTPPVEGIDNMCRQCRHPLSPEHDGIGCNIPDCPCTFTGAAIEEPSDALPNAGAEKTNAWTPEFLKRNPTYLTKIEPKLKAKWDGASDAQRRKWAQATGSGDIANEAWDSIMRMGGSTAEVTMEQMAEICGELINAVQKYVFRANAGSIGEEDVTIEANSEVAAWNKLADEFATTVADMKRDGIKLVQILQNGIALCQACLQRAGAKEGKTTITVVQIAHIVEREEAGHLEVYCGADACPCENKNSAHDKPGDSCGAEGCGHARQIHANGLCNACEGAASGAMPHEFMGAKMNADPNRGGNLQTQLDQASAQPKLGENANARPGFDAAMEAFEAHVKTCPTCGKAMAAQPGSDASAADKYCAKGQQLLTADLENAADGWKKGSVEHAGKRYDYQAKVYEEGSEYGINGGRVSKLHVKRAEDRWDKPVIEYDRGWGTQPGSEHRPILDKLLSELHNGYVTSEKMVMKANAVCPKCGDSGRLFVSEKTGLCDACMNEAYKKENAVENGTTADEVKRLGEMVQAAARDVAAHPTDSAQANLRDLKARLAAAIEKDVEGEKQNEGAADNPPPAAMAALDTHFAGCQVCRPDDAPAILCPAAEKILALENKDVMAKGGDEHNGKPGGTVTIINADPGYSTAENREHAGAAAYGSIP